MGLSLAWPQLKQTRLALQRFHVRSNQPRPQGTELLDHTEGLFAEISSRQSLEINDGIRVSGDEIGHRGDSSDGRLLTMDSEHRSPGGRAPRFFASVYDGGRRPNPDVADRPPSAA
jgi:hypothetical protein